MAKVGLAKHKGRRKIGKKKRIKRWKRRNKKR
jgi:hypothetical protein